MAGLLWGHHIPVSIAIMDTSDKADKYSCLTFSRQLTSASGAHLPGNINRLYLDVPLLIETGMFKGRQPGVLQDLQFKIRKSREPCFDLAHINNAPGYRWSSKFERGTEISLESL